MNLKTYLVTRFEIKNLGTLEHFLGIEVARPNEGIVISQCKYTLDLLRKKRKVGAKLVETSVERDHGLHSQRRGATS